MKRNYVGNGAFKLAEWKERDHVTLVKNPSYWDTKNVRLEKVTALPIEDTEGALRELLKEDEAKK